MVDYLAKPPRFFNTTGPCDPERHYMLPPKERLIDTNLERMVTHQLYWVLHAPRQTGKTTFLLSWAKELNATGQVVAAYVSVETCQAVPDPAVAMPAIVGAGCFLCIVNTMIAVVMIPYAWDEIWLSLVAMRNMMARGASFWQAFTGKAAHLAFPAPEAG